MIVKHLLQGRPLGHPLHPILNHFPIALFVISLLFDIGSLFAPAPNPLAQAAFYTMSLGTVMGVLAAVTGLADYIDIRRDHPGRPSATLHMSLNLGVLLLYAANLNLRYGDFDAAQTPLLPFIMSAVGVGVIGLSGYLGGKLVYDDGIAVGRHLRHTDTPRDTLKISPRVTATLDGFVPVADSASLKEGSTLRVQVGGTVIALARLDGQTYAFQEFCTHRFGPLSEGNFHDHQVQCPWHRSCFDVRTGKVTQGPAKVDLNVYDSKVEGGKILVRVKASGEE